MRQFTTGAVRDDATGKEMYVETISWTALKRYAKYMTAKREKYGKGNFKKGIPCLTSTRVALWRRKKTTSPPYFSTPSVSCTKKNVYNKACASPAPVPTLARDT